MIRDRERLQADTILRTNGKDEIPLEIDVHGLQFQIHWESKYDSYVVVAIHRKPWDFVPSQKDCHGQNCPFDQLQTIPMYLISLTKDLVGLNVAKDRHLELYVALFPREEKGCLR